MAHTEKKLTKKRRASLAEKEAADKRKKRTALICIICAAAVVIAAAGAVILLNQPKLVQLTKSGSGSYIDSKNGIEYLSAPINYEPYSVSDAYAECGDTVLYAIPGLRTDTWLSEKYDGIGAVWYSSAITLPTLENFYAEDIRICTVDEITVQIGEITDKALVSSIVEAMTAYETVTPPQENFTTYHLKITSNTYSCLYYDILYIDDGVRGYLYDRGTKRAVDIGDMLAGYIIREVSE